MWLYKINKYLKLLFVIGLLGANASADWAANFGAYGVPTTTAKSTFDSSGNMYVAGGFTGTTMVFGGTTLNRIGSNDAYVVKLDSSGNVLWAKNFGGAGANAGANAIAADGSGNVYLSGNFSNADLTTPALSRIGSTDVFALKLDSSGNITWAKNFGGAGANMTGRSIAVDGSGNVYLGGYFFTANLTAPSLTKIGFKDTFAIKLDSSGNTTWGKNFGGASANALCASIAVDASGNVYLGGELSFAGMTTPTLPKLGSSDAFAIKLDSSGNSTWAKNYGGGVASVSATSIAVDSSGNVYLGGYFYGFDLSTPSLTRTGIQDGFVFKLDSSGNTTWAKDFGDSGGSAYVWGNSIAVDGSGNVYLGGQFSTSDLTAPSLTKIGTQDAFAVKLDSSGNTTWAKNYGGSGASAYGNSIGVDPSGNVYLGGYFQAANLTTPALSISAATKDVFAFKLNSSGTTAWAKNFGGGPVANGIMVVRSVARDSSGNLYLTGTSSSYQLVFGAATLTRIGNQDAFVVKLDSSGSVLWAKNFGGLASTVNSQSIAVDGSGNVYVGGYFFGALTTPALTQIGLQDAFAIKLNSSGNTIWAKNYGGATAYTYATGIAVDVSGNVYLGGYFDSADLTSPTLTKIGSSDSFAIKIDSSGNSTWAKNFGGASATSKSKGIAVDQSGNVYMAGYYSNANLTTPALTKIGTDDAFAFKLDSSGNTTWAKTFGGTGGASALAQAITTDGSGNVYIGGYFYSSNLTTPALTKIGTYDSYVFKLDSAGNTTWAKNFGGAGAVTYGYSVAVDPGGTIYLAGYFDSANLTTPVLTKIGSSSDTYAIKLDSNGNTTWSKAYGGTVASTLGVSTVVDGTGNIYIAGSLSGGDLTSPTLTKISGQDALLINTQLFRTACASGGKFKYDAANTVMVFCDGSYWQSLNNASSVACSGTTAGKLQYYVNGASSDFVWYGGGQCRSAKSSTTYGACAVDGKVEWYSGGSTLRGCINGTWTSLKGY